MSVQKAWPFLIVGLVPILPIIGFIKGGLWHFITPLVVFVLVPFLDLFIPNYEKNPTAEEIESLSNNGVYKYITWLMVPLHLGLVIWGIFIASQGFLSWWEFILFSIGVGISSGVVGINTSHELGHRIDNRIEPIMSRIMLWPTLYMHWIYEHVVGHHRHVATPKDPATALYGMSFYRFWFRTVGGTYKSIWMFEKNRLKKKNIFPYSLKNKVLQISLIEILTIILIFIISGVWGMLFFIMQAVIAFSLLEIINYVEHYGLLRKKQENGKYERVRPIHSWNSNRWLTNHFLFQLQRHSDHHYRPRKRYQILEFHEESLQLPTGYAGMVLLALIPPIFKKIMHKRIPSEMIELTKNN